MHRCQGAGQLGADPGPAEGVFSLLDAEPAVAAAESDILDGVGTTLTALAPSAPGLAPELAALQAKANAARAAFDPAAPERAVPALAEALDAVRALAEGLDIRVADAAARAELAERLREEAADVEAALALAQGLVLEARADDGLVTPGEEMSVAVSVFNSGRDWSRGGGARARGASGLDGGASRGRGRPASRRGRSAVALHRRRRPRRPPVAALLAPGKGPRPQ